MRHRKARRKLGGYTGSHQRAMYSNMLGSLLEHGRIETTEAKARALRSMAERVVTRAASLGDLLLQDMDKLEVEDRARLVHARRMVRRTLRQPEAVFTLFADIAPRYIGRPGGYTRIIKKGFRRGDGAAMAYVEFVDAEHPLKEGETEEPEKKKGLLDRFRRS